MEQHWEDFQVLNSVNIFPHLLETWISINYFSREQTAFRSIHKVPKIIEENMCGIWTSLYIQSTWPQWSVICFWSSCSVLVIELQIKPHASILMNKHQLFSMSHLKHCLGTKSTRKCSKVDLLPFLFKLKIDSQLHQPPSALLWSLYLTRPFLSRFFFSPSTVIILTICHVYLRNNLTYRDNVLWSLWKMNFCKDAALNYLFSPNIVWYFLNFLL